MDDDLKISLTELIIGFREPETGIERHFLKVIKKQALACTTEEKVWYRWWLSTQKIGLEHRKAQIQEDKMANSLHSTEIEKNLTVQKIKRKKPGNSQSTSVKRIPARVQKIINQIAKFDSDALDRRLSGSYGSGKRSR